MTRTLVVVDVQNDFCEGGSMGVDGGSTVASAVAETIAADTYDVVVATKDHHIDPGDHFSDSPDFVDSWPPHCVVGTVGEAFHDPIEESLFAEVFRKGEYDAAYSGFEGTSDDGTNLASWLRAHGVTAFDVCGIATDYCVRATALDGAREGFDVTVLRSLTAAVSAANLPKVEDEFKAANVDLR